MAISLWRADIRDAVTATSLAIKINKKEEGKTINLVIETIEQQAR